MPLRVIISGLELDCPAKGVQSSPAMLILMSDAAAPASERKLKRLPHGPEAAQRLVRRPE